MLSFKSATSYLQNCVLCTLRTCRFLRWQHTVKCCYNALFWGPRIRLCYSSHRVIAAGSPGCVLWFSNNQFSEVWSHAPKTHNCMDRNHSLPLGTNGAMYCMVSIILCMSRADIDSAHLQWYRMFCILILILGRGATVNSWVRKCIPMN